MYFAEPDQQCSGQIIVWIILINFAQFPMFWMLLIQTFSTPIVDFFFQRYTFVNIDKSNY